MSGSMVKEVAVRRHPFDAARWTLIETAFQPIVDIRTAAVFGYEALMRGHDRIGFADPIAALDEAERTGQLFGLEQMMERLALGAFSSLPNRAEATLFLNLDARLIPQGLLLVEGLLQLLKTRCIPPSSVCFEFSERFDNSAFPEIAGLIAYMRKSGFKLAIDDFGVGHSEMRLLCDQVVDYIKVDRHFVTGADTAMRKRHFLKSAVSMAHMLGARVIAEGIETEGELAVCRDLGVDMAQGWLIARPMADVSQWHPRLSHFPDHKSTATPLQSLDDILIRKQIEVLPTVFENEPIDTVFELFRRNPRQAYFPVLNANNEPRGIIHEYSLKAYIYQPFGRDLLKNKAYERTISHFMEPAPVVSINSTVDDLMGIFADVDDATCLVVIEDLRYAGVVSAASLVKAMTEKQLKTAQDQNPLTGLPGNHAIRDFMRMTAGGTVDAIRYFCYCDFDAFKPFNDAYGFHIGDHAISLFAALMRRHFLLGTHFLGHVGGDDFFIGVIGGSREELTETLDRLRADFSNDVAALYPSDDRERGYITGHDRSGAETIFSLMRCSIGVVELPEGTVIDDIGNVSKRIAGLKTKAKESASGLVFEQLCETN
ncbi:GGDEF domain-containing protein [Rhizobium sp. B230/85]|nr:GGDEF domain-containing protein [Rhizobium sp. L58/93]MBO9133512.1 GGDEF domain-containing protein [Rhizobium sp. B209b/85]MBO9167854.1 GGDEF domain-containing protein [Rhizobium sp. L245/93]MBO9183899.1 GGDEF domain-containing protein [Rhizobium sp. E27B/91]QXZ84139.1 GGDEF domain-containing protein [Rhizobium sp. K1/93]QXZ91722.1 GGDEF domain-containing protein [Rhizobium sp. K15/93]QXZ97317.1 GGDEF domain-containing protein [Rhizobium sp. B230/85]QYA00933.1 GGDEF domain-containing prot